ncbi:hypothetical protein Tco_0863193 [Tanacetum coccineum]
MKFLIESSYVMNSLAMRGSHDYLVDKGKSGSSGADDDGFIKVKKKKSGGNNGGTKTFKPVLVKPKTILRLKVNQLTAEVSPKTTPSIGKKNVTTLGNSIKTARKMNVLTSGNRNVSLSNSFDALNDDDLVTVEVESIEKDLMEGKCMFVDDDGKPLEKVEYGTKSLLKQWNDSCGNADYDYDPYDNDMYEGQEIPDNLHAMCDNLNIKVRGRNMK